MQSVIATICQRICHCWLGYSHWSDYLVQPAGELFVNIHITLLHTAALNHLFSVDFNYFHLLQRYTTDRNIHSDLKGHNLYPFEWLSLWIWLDSVSYSEISETAWKQSNWIKLKSACSPVAAFLACSAKSTCTHHSTDTSATRQCNYHRLSLVIQFH